jgi:protease-4
MTGCLLFFLSVVVTPQMPLSLATTDDARAVFANPAGLAVARENDFLYFYNAHKGEFSHNHSFALNLGGLGGFWEPKPSRYGLALGIGSRTVMSGLRMVRDTVTRWDMGAMTRPARWLSLGAVWQNCTRNWGWVQLGAALRPLGSRLTLFAETQSLAWSQYAVGFEAEPVNGLGIACRVMPDPNLRSTKLCAGLSLGLGRTGIEFVTARPPSELGLALRLGSRRPTALVPGPRRYLELKLHEQVVDQKPGFSLAGAGPARLTWTLLSTIDRAAQDRSVRALVLELDGASMSFAQAQELRQALARFKAQGKKVYVYAPHLHMLGYYIASVADKIVSHPLGEVWIPGMSAQAVFLKGTLEKLGLKVNYTRHGRYKSAVEMFSEDSLTPDNREQLQALVDAAYDEFVRAASDGRRLPRETIEARVNHGFFLAARSQAVGLIDTVCYRDELDSLLKTELAGLRRCSDHDYARQEERGSEWQEPPTIAIVYALGSIRTGESGTDFLTGEQSMGANTMVRAIRAARKDRRVKAIVLRINSPGGDGYASDLIWRELELARKKKPLIVSMGSVAASGGYYIACNSRRVFALPGTVTGSIGVFSLKFVTEGLYNKLGARRETVKRGERADAMSDLRELAPEEDSLLQDMVDDFYRQFVAKVAQGRGLSVEKVDSVGQGRVWAGTDAHAAGIVDTLGGLLDAVEYAKEQAGLKDCSFVFYPKPRADFLSRAGGFVRDQVLRAGYE